MYTDVHAAFGDVFHSFGSKNHEITRRFCSFFCWDQKSKKLRSFGSKITENTSSFSFGSEIVNLLQFGTTIPRDYWECLRVLLTRPVVLVQKYMKLLKFFAITISWAKGTLGC